MKDQDSARAVGNIPSGLFIVAASDETGKIDGYLASWVQQVSFDPLMVSIAIKPGRPCYDHIVNGRAFTINVVGEHNKNIMKHFWGGYDPQKNPFDEISFERNEDGGIVLNDAKSAIVCQMSSMQEPGDHELVMAEVKASYTNEEQAGPAIHLRKSGKDY